MPGSFFDTKVLLCVASGDPAKADRAEELMGAGDQRAGAEPDDQCIDIHETGLALAERYGASTWDATIGASALHADCDTLWSEDMQDGILLDYRVRIVNPFRAF